MLRPQVKQHCIFAVSGQRAATHTYHAQPRRREAPGHLRFRFDCQGQCSQGSTVHSRPTDQIRMHGDIELYPSLHAWQIIAGRCRNLHIMRLGADRMCTSVQWPRRDFAGSPHKYRAPMLCLLLTIEYISYAAGTALRGLLCKRAAPARAHSNLVACHISAIWIGERS